MFVSRSVPQPGLRWNAQHPQMSLCHGLDPQLRVYSIVLRFGVRSSGSNLSFPLNVMYDLGLGHSVGFYNSLSTHL